MGSQQILGPAEVADMLGLKRSTVYVMKSRGDLPEPDITTAGRHPLWMRDTIIRWAEQNGRNVKKGTN